MPFPPLSIPAAMLAALLATASAPAAAMSQTITVLAADGRPLPRVAVSVLPKGERRAAPAGTHAEMSQRQKQFVPSTLVVQQGTAVHFPNFDTVRHHVYSFSPARRFEIKLYVGRPSAPVVFDAPGTATLGCNIHDTMVGYIHVVETPYFGTTDEAGRVTLDIPAGDHVVQWWHPLLGEQRPPLSARLAAGAPVTLTLRP